MLDNLTTANVRYKQHSTQCYPHFKFEIGDFVWDVQPKEQFLVRELQQP